MPMAPAGVSSSRLVRLNKPSKAPLALVGQPGTLRAQSVTTASTPLRNWKREPTVSTAIAGPGRGRRAAACLSSWRLCTALSTRVMTGYCISGNSTAGATHDSMNLESVPGPCRRRSAKAHQRSKLRAHPAYVPGGASHVWTTEGPEPVDRDRGLMDADSRPVDDTFQQLAEDRRRAYRRQRSCRQARSVAGTGMHAENLTQGRQGVICRCAFPIHQPQAPVDDLGTLSGPHVGKST